MKYQREIVLAYFKEQGLPLAQTEFKFHPERRWKFDFAWQGNLDDQGHWFPKTILGFFQCLVALEVDGGIWIAGGHNRGAQIKKTWEKENTAVCMGWRILKCEPKDLCTLETVNLIRSALALTS